MVTCIYKKGPLKIEHRWFAEQNDDFKSKADIIFMHGVETKDSSKSASSSLQKTVIKDLSLPENELFLTLGKHLRQYIKRSMKEDVQIEIFDSQKLLNAPDLLNKIGGVYEKMYEDKDMNVKFNRSLANTYAKANALCVATATINDNLVGFDAIIHDDNHARLWLAAFDFRNEAEDSQKLSRAHQRMDWELLVWCKNQGMVNFDFGGIASFDNPNGIDAFKMKFESNNKVEYYNIIKPNSLIGHVAMKVRSLKK